MKRYSTSTGFKFWTPKKATNKVIGSLLILLVFLIPIILMATEEIRFSENEKSIINSVVNQFRRECGHASVLDASKLREIQDFYQNKKEEMPEPIKNCYGEYLSQLVGTHNIHQQTCDEITPKKNLGKDKDLARIFINVKKFQTGIRNYHEKLNECLIRKGADSKYIIALTDFEKNGRILSKKIREVNVQMPFKENSVDYR
jgi:hypothetical protein